MDPCCTNKPMPIQRDTVIRFNGAVRVNRLQHLPSRLRLTLYVSSEPIMDLPFNLDTQMLSATEESSSEAWVTEVSLHPSDMNFQVTVSVPLNFFIPSASFLCVSCALFNPALNDYCYTGPKFSFPILLKPNISYPSRP